MEKRRLSVVLSERSVDRLDSLKNRTDASSVTEVIKAALMTYESIADHLEKGVVFMAHKPNGECFAVEFMIDVSGRRLSVIQGGKP